MKLQLMDKPRVLLVNPPCPFLAYPNAAPHLGMGYLASYLRENQIIVDYANYEASDPNQIELPEGYNYYGFTATTPQYHFAKLLKNQVQERYLGQTIIGGSHASVMAKACYTDGFDYVVKGYGEIATLSIVQGEQSKGIIQGLPYKIDETPSPAWDLLYQTNYDFSYGKNTGHIFSARGCPYDCYYCCSQAIYGRKVHFSAIGKVIEEIIYLKDNFGVDTIYFFDPIFTVNRNRTMKLAAALKLLEINWTCQTRVDMIDLELLSHMKASGCDQISFGIETGSPEAYDKLNKKTNIDQNALAIQMTHDAGMKVKSFLMGALPDDNWSTSEQLKEFILLNKPDNWLYSTFTPFPGTDYWPNSQKYGIEILRKDFRSYYPLGLNARGPVNIKNKYMDREELEAVRDDMLNFLRKEIPNLRVEEAINLFPEQKTMFEKYIEDMEDTEFMFGR